MNMAGSISGPLGYTYTPKSIPTAPLTLGLSENTIKYALGLKVESL